ncbi:ATP synthase delta/epsilon chain alpha-helix domain-containing protein [Periweissella cryptocerci]|nr:ATP synthase delta/epsilon chain alpha-helix domain-containing protein [Periweissella cryptocerci]
MNTITVSLTTPDGVNQTYSSVRMLTFGTSAGYETVMANHVPVIAVLGIEVMRLTFADYSIKQVFVNDGVLEFKDSAAIIVAQTSEDQDKIDLVRAQAAKERAESRLSNDEFDQKRAEVALKKAMTRIKTVTGL